VNNDPEIPITVVIPIKNEAVNLPGCLDKLRFFAHVVVIDSGSSDESAEIARQHGAEVLLFEWNGQFPKKRNWCLRTYDFQTEWVLFLDADEQVTPEFVREVSEVTRDTRYNGFWVAYQNYFMGRLLKHGDPFRKLPLLRLGHGEFERIDERMWSKLDMEVHEHLVIEGKVGEIKSPVIHNDFKGLQAYYDRHNQYSSWEAARYLQQQKASSAQWTARQKLKYRLMESNFLPFAYFFVSYIIKGGFLDGNAGWRFAVSKCFYFFQINFKIAELRERERLAESAEQVSQAGKTSE
jgi:glycosyltransferase involved in cell wall biosynthesis